jgi:predicted ATPase with chaperone activity
VWGGLEPRGVTWGVSQGRRFGSLVVVASLASRHRSALSRRLTTLLPAMTLAEAMETTRIRRVAGLTGDRTALSRPARVAPRTIRSRMQG